MASPISNKPVALTTPTRYSEKHEQMIKTLASKISTLHSEISKTESLLSEAQAKLNPPNAKGADTDTAVPKDATAIVQRHIRLLHEYNEIKDIGQGLIGLIAEARGVRHVDVQRDFGVGDRD
ncbi:DNA repair protein Swi5/Sae3 [[Emmonsia] crescens]|uniref:DNA repair protein Swi5/Sae3 n=1 Tax=[Emmonsia] crescens TaxID=73230 RepID=A0A2B7Z5S2_9EURO|nr:DNA repair protein Swi5/Sae3 [Emmonsia crescens]